MRDCKKYIELYVHGKKWVYKNNNPNQKNKITTHVQKLTEPLPSKCMILRSLNTHWLEKHPSLARKTSEMDDELENVENITEQTQKTRKHTQTDMRT